MVIEAVRPTVHPGHGRANPRAPPRAVSVATGHKRCAARGCERAAAAESSVHDERNAPGEHSVSYFVEWVAAFIAPVTVVFLLVPGFVLIGVVLVLIMLALLVVALAAAIVAAPYLLGSLLRRRWRALSAVDGGEIHSELAKTALPHRVVVEERRPR
jgi:hypothetical protein